MLEVLLLQYKDIFGEDFPLAEVSNMREIDVINILYDCVSNNVEYDPLRPVRDIITDAPGLNK